MSCNFTAEGRRLGNRNAVLKVRRLRDQHFSIVGPEVAGLRDRGLSYREIAHVLDCWGYRTRLGAHADATHVMRIDRWNQEARS